MRRSLDRLLGRPVEALLDRLERGVSVDEQRGLALRGVRGALEWSARELDEPARGQLAALCGDLSRALAPGAPGAEIAACDGPASLPDGVDDESSPGAFALHLATLREGTPPRAASQAASCEAAGARSAGVPLEASSLQLLAGLGAGSLTPDAARRGARALAEGFEARHWFPRKGIRLGSANLLRTLLLATPPETQPDGYVDDVCERLLRHVEVRRDEALRLASAPRAPWQAPLEALRFTLALLDAAARSGDARFLNAALKLNERHHRVLLRAQRGQGLGQVLLALHYAASVARQEAWLARRFP